MSLAVPDQRTLQRVAATLRWRPLDGEGVPVNPGTVTVSVASSAGTALVTDAATTGTGDAERSYTLAATNAATLDTLTVSWRVSGSTVATTYLEVCGGFWASLPEIVDRVPGVEVGANWTSTQIVRWRTQVETEMEHLLRWAGVPRYAYERIAAPGTRPLPAAHGHVTSVRSARLLDTETSYTDLTATELGLIAPDSAGLLRRTDGGSWGSGQVLIGYEHGRTRPPSDLLDAFFILLGYRMSASRSKLPDRATTLTTPEGLTTVLAVPGRGQWHTGIPTVDEVIARYTMRHPAIA